MSPRNDQAGSALCVFAHPDDEILAMGGALQFMAPADIVLVTDGAPPWIEDPVTYGAMRRAETRRAIAGTGVAHRLHFLGFSDQGVAAAARELIGALVPFITQAGQIFTHALEHGHPDHDAVCLSVHAAAHIGQRHHGITECPLYRCENGSLVLSAFDAGAIELASAFSTRKRDMLGCFESQRDFLDRFPVDREAYCAVPLRSGVKLDALLQSYPEGIPSSTSAGQWRKLGALLEAASP